MSDSLERLSTLKPWDNVNEEDLYKVDGIWVSVRGNTRAPNGAWCTSEKSQAEKWVTNPDDGPGSGWSYDAETGAAKVGDVDDASAQSALAKVLSHFEGTTLPGVEFPVFLNPESSTGESLPKG